MKNNRGSNIAHVGISLIHVSLVFGHTSTRDTSGRKRRSAFLRLFALLEFFPDSSRPRKWLLRPLLRALDRCRDIAHSSRPGTSPPRPPPRAGGPTTARRPPTHPRASRRVSSPKTRFLFSCHVECVSTDSSASLAHGASAPRAPRQAPRARRARASRRVFFAHASLTLFRATRRRAFDRRASLLVKEQGKVGTSERRFRQRKGRTANGVNRNFGT